MRNTNPVQQPNNQSGPGVIVDISPRGWAAYEQSRMEKGKIQDLDKAGPVECATCESRRYIDGSDDPSVSFQTPTHIGPGESAAAVAAHEAEHVSNEQARAERDGREIISQTVTLHTSICPECNRVYVSGGQTRTISRQSEQPESETAESSYGRGGE